MKRTLAAGLLLIALALAAWWPAGPCGFVFDDIPLVAENATIQRGDALAALLSQHEVMSNRALTSCWLALQRGLLGPDADGFRLVNVALHAINVLLLAVVLRRALARPAVGLPPARADRLAFAIAAVFAVHPLAADAVAYVAQQSMLLMAMWFLLALLALPRALAAQRTAGVAVVACIACGMASKEEFVAAPILLLLYARAFHAASWRELRAHWPLWSALAATWLVLLYCVDNGPPNVTAGWHVEPATSAVEWLQTQAAVVLHYARLAVLPVGQRTYYDWPVVRDLAAAALPGLAVLSLLAATAWSWRRRPVLAFLPSLFFLLLAPTSSILPLPTEVVAERRAYLPMLAIVVPLALLVDAALRRLAGRDKPIVFAAIALAVVAAALPAARARVGVYTEAATFWADSYQRNECTNQSFQASMVLSNYGLVMRKQGDLDRALDLFRRALETTAQDPLDRVHYAMLQAQRGNRAMAEPILRLVIRDAPETGEAHGSLATLLLDEYLADPAAAGHREDPRLTEAIELARTAVRLLPQRAAHVNTLAWLLAQVGKPQEAEPLYRRAIELEPHQLQPYVNLTDLLAAQGRGAEASMLWNQLLSAFPQDVDLRVAAGAALIQRHYLTAARRALQDAVRLQPDNAQAKQLLAQLATMEQGSKR